MADLRTFSRRIALRAEEVGRNADAAVRAVALAADQAVAVGTPVDTGRARSNWVVSVGGPRSGTLPPYAPGKRLGRGESANLAAALAQGAAAIGARQSGQDVYIQNNIPYIGLLNQGSSRQAPENFVELGVQSAIEALRRRRLVGGN